MVVMGSDQTKGKRFCRGGGGVFDHRLGWCADRGSGCCYIRRRGFAIPGTRRVIIGTDTGAMGKGVVCCGGGGIGVATVFLLLLLRENETTLHG